MTKSKKSAVEIATVMNESVNFNVNRCPELIKTLKSCEYLEEYEILAAYIYRYFIENYAESYADVFKDEKVCVLTFMYMGYGRICLTLDSSGTPVESKFESEKYLLSDFCEVVKQILPEGVPDFVSNVVENFLLDLDLSEEDKAQRGRMFNIFEQYLAKRWALKKVKFTYDLDEVKVEVER